MTTAKSLVGILNINEFVLDAVALGAVGMQKFRIFELLYLSKKLFYCIFYN